MEDITQVVPDDSLWDHVEGMILIAANVIIPFASLPSAIVRKIGSYDEGHPSPALIVLGLISFVGSWINPVAGLCGPAAIKFALLFRDRTSRFRAFKTAIWLNVFGLVIAADRSGIIDTVIFIKDQLIEAARSFVSALS